MATDARYISRDLDELEKKLARFSRQVPKRLPETHETPEIGVLVLDEWPTAPLDGILSVTDSIAALNEEEFLGFIPVALRTVLRFKDDPRAGNLFHSIQYRLIDGFDRAAILSRLNEHEHEVVFAAMQRVHLTAFGCEMS